MATTITIEPVPPGAIAPPPHVRFRAPAHLGWSICYPMSGGLVDVLLRVTDPFASVGAIANHVVTLLRDFPEPQLTALEVRMGVYRDPADPTPIGWIVLSRGRVILWLLVGQEN